MNTADNAIRLITFPTDNEVRARTVVSRSRARATGKYPSWKMGRMLQWESHNELNALRLLDANPAVLEFFDQPCVIHYQLGGKEHRHYPDTLVKTATTKYLWEVKTTANARRTEVLERTELLTAKLPAQGYQYAVVLAEDLAREPRMRQTRILLKNGRTPLTFEQKEHARLLFSETSSLLWRHLLEGLYKPFTLQQACRLILEGALHVNLDAPFGATTLVTQVAGSTLLGGSNG